jgi:arabinose-5-phosphate isomerase
MAASDRLGSGFFDAVSKILRCSGKVITTGLGKSGYVARKMASTLSSTGTPSFFIHPAEAMHGDFGMISKEDAILAIAHSGETREVLGVAKFAKQLGIPVIAITGKPGSSLDQLACISLDGAIDQEADSLGLAPTVSSTLALAICDALAVAVMRGRGFTTEEFAKLHPGGSLGRSLASVSDYMQPVSRILTVSPLSTFDDVLAAITQHKHNFGIVAVVNGSGCLVGAISDGDIRRALSKHRAEALAMTADQLMTRTPKTIFSDLPAMDSVRIMEQFSIVSIFVVDRGAPDQCIGMIRLHDLTAAKVI